jgi:hypothetical protein
MVLTNAQKMGLEAAIWSYLVAEGDRFANVLAAFAAGVQELGLDGFDEKSYPKVSGAILERAWRMVHRDVTTSNEAFFEAIEAGNLAEVKLLSIGVDVKSLRYEVDEEMGTFEDTPLGYAARHDRLDIVRHFVKEGHNIEVGGGNRRISPLSVSWNRAQTRMAAWTAACPHYGARRREVI